MNGKKAAIAIIGSRGIPSKYGGFETFTEYISTEFAKNGYKIFVSCEHMDKEDRICEYNGVNLFYFPLKSPKGGLFRILYEFIYDVYSLWWASRRADVIYMLGYSASFFFFIPKLFGKRLLVNPDGLEWKRSKFNPLIKSLLKLSERVMVFWTKEIVADSKNIKYYFDNKYRLNCYFIPYGVSKIKKISWDENKIDFNIIPKDYWLVVARLEPENNIEMIIEGYLKSKTKKSLVIVGNFASGKYEFLIKGLLKNKPDEKKIIFTGGIYNPEKLNMVRQNCYGYIHGHSVGGTNPSLLEAMMMKSIIIAHDNEFNREVCGDFALYFNNSDYLSHKLAMIDSNREKFIEFGVQAHDRVLKKYSWDGVIKDYETLLGEVSK